MKDNKKDYEKAKEAAAKAAVQLVEENMIIGVGTGSTAAYFIQHLAERCHNGLSITAVATSEETASKLEEAQVPLITTESFTIIDLTVDGADEIDPQHRLIKGRGGALVREKIVASSSKKMIVIADESKLVEQLGHTPLPVEIIPFGYHATIEKMRAAGYNHPVLRVDSQTKPVVTDNHNVIVDIHFQHLLLNPGREHQKIVNIPGVVDTGFFFHLATHILIGYSDGHADFLTKKNL